MFQHTAARRRLVPCRRSMLRHFGGFNTQPPEGGWWPAMRFAARSVRFNTQPPEGGWGPTAVPPTTCGRFQHTAARRRLAGDTAEVPDAQAFQHTAARRRLVPVALYFSYSLLFQHTAARRRLGASLKSLAPSGFTTPISPNSQEKCEREYNTAFSVTPAFTIS